MITIVLPTKYYSKIFIKQGLPNFIKNYVLHTMKLDKSRLKMWDDYLKENYDITFNKAIKLCTDNFYCSKMQNSLYIFKQNETAQYKNYKISTIASLINDGNLEIHGTNLFNKVCKAVQNKPKTYFLMYTITKDGSNLWQ